MKRPATARFTVGLLTVATVALVPAACEDSVTDPPAGDGETTLSVFLKDAPGDVDSVWVQVDDIVLMGEGGGTSVLSEPSELINVTALRDEAALLIEDFEIEAGSFNEVRFVLGGAVLEAGEDVYTFGGAEHPGGLTSTGTLHCPSCAQSGIKVKLSGDLEIEEGDNGLLLDFDVSQSFGHRAGNSGKWVMHPVIHAAEADPGDIDDGEVGGEITGTVVLGADGQGNPITVPVCGGEQRTLFAFAPTATSTVLTDDEGNPITFLGTTEADGTDFTFSIDVLSFDVYTMGHDEDTTYDTEKLVWQATAEPTTVTVDEGNPTAEGVVYTVTSVTCETLTP